MDEAQRLQHQEKVRRIAEAVRQHAETARPGEHFSLKKAQVSHTVPRPDDPKRMDRKIDVRTLTEILSIDPERRLCVAESGVSFEKLVEATLPYGLLPQTVSELKTITIGGAVAGCSVESMSYRYGGFHDGCTGYEIVTGTGEVITCSREQRSDIFEMVHGSFGTVGILTLLTFRLVPAKKYVRTDYLRFTTFQELMAAVQRHNEAQDLDFMDAIVHGPGECVLCTGTFTDEAPYTSEYFLKPFYRSTQRRTLDYFRTPDYLFRYDADCHWIIRNFGLENPLLRRLLAPFALGSSNILRMADRFPILTALQKRPDVVVDVFIPFERIDEFYDWYHTTFRYYPLWIVPYRIESMYPWVNPVLVPENRGNLFIDCAIYGFHQHGKLNYYKALEEKVYELGGIKTLITHNYYTEDEFWASYNRPAYEAVKAQTDPKGIFRDLYTKTNWKKLAEPEPTAESSPARSSQRRNPLQNSGLWRKRTRRPSLHPGS